MITTKAVRELALSLPEAEEHDHWGRPSFRVRGKIFATLHEGTKRFVIKASREEQDLFTTSDPETFEVAPGGAQGWMFVDLSRVDAGVFKELLVGAWRRLAPKRAIAALNATGDPPRGRGKPRPSKPRARPRRARKPRAS